MDKLFDNESFGGRTWPFTTGPRRRPQWAPFQYNSNPQRRAASTWETTCYPHDSQPLLRLRKINAFI